MSKSGVLNKVPGQSILRGQQIDLLPWLCFVRCLWLPFLLSFHIVISSFGGIVSWPHPCRPLAEIRDRFKGKIYFFRDYYVFGKKFDQIKTNKVVNFLFHFSIKCRFNQVSFRSIVASIKCHSINCRDTTFISRKRGRVVRAPCL